MHEMIHEEESKLVKRHGRRPKKPFFIESRMPESGIPGFTKWHRHSGYETEARRDQALHDLRKGVHRLPGLAFEYRVSGKC